eukprot:GHUV01008528.1.p1 GENE.GHUV01008528.1~~GHUV01008528.1.p1  ORF type:complete len:257 (+),score=19.75 GHUV01008528.1:468-1238(+)
MPKCDIASSLHGVPLQLQSTCCCCCRQWPPGYCSTHDCDTRPPPGTPYTLHGLWPERVDPDPQYGRKWPECCDTRFKFSEKNIQDLVPELCQFWPSWSAPQNETCSDVPAGPHSECFWKHEWDKHGTCSAVNAGGSQQYLEPHEYLEQVLKLHQQYDIQGALSTADITPSDRDAYDSDTILEALENAFKATAYIECKRGLLTEVTTCFDKNLELIDCPQISYSCTSVRIPTGERSDRLHYDYNIKDDMPLEGVATN